MKRERYSESEGELLKMEDERGNGRMEEWKRGRRRMGERGNMKTQNKRKWMRERARSNIDSKEL
jgi:hypothetical protein